MRCLRPAWRLKSKLSVHQPRGGKRKALLNWQQDTALRSTWARSQHLETTPSQRDYLWKACKAAGKPKKVLAS